MFLLQKKRPRNTAGTFTDKLQLINEIKTE